MSRISGDIGLSAPSTAARGWQFDALKFWAVLGAAWLAFIAYVMIRWMLSDSFVPTDPGPDVMPEHVRLAVFWAQVIGPIGWLFILWRWLIQPWRRNGQPSIEGFLVIGWTLVYFQDPFMSYTANHLTYNAHLVNFGAWTTGIFPGWNAPNTQHLAEPIVVGMTAYVYAGFLPALFVSWCLRRARLRWPQTGLWTPLLLALLALMFIDTVIESAIIRLELMTYPGSIHAISLWPGTQYQFPMSEALTWGFNMMTSTLLLTFRGDNGQTLIERGMDRHKKAPAMMNGMRLLAAIAFVQMGQLTMWSIPMQWFGTHGDAWPELPSYLRNQICGEGTDMPCPGPGEAIPRVH